MDGARYGQAVHIHQGGPDLQGDQHNCQHQRPANHHTRGQKGKSAPTIVSSHYREFTGGVSGLQTLGDTNICYQKSSVTGNPQTQHINRIKEIQTDAALHQMIESDTRYQMVYAVMQRSIIDHIYTNCSSVILPPEIVPVGTSDHQSLLARKVSRAP